MKKPGGLLALFLLLAAVAFAASYWAGARLGSSVSRTHPDDLEWLRREFGLSEAEMGRIRALHEAYLPRCREYCERIAEGKSELEDLLAAGDLTNPAIETALAEIGRRRARCQAAMLRHFQQVSEAMPPEQGARYLAKMQQLTLGAHEEVERRMAVEANHGHGHH